jgi:polyisoprenoid-binding protein YceI
MATPYTFDFVHSHVGFTVRHMIVSKVRGSFDKWSGEFLVDEQDLTKSSVSIAIEAASIDTKQAQRDEHLRSADFFDAANHPALTFKSKRIEKDGDAYKIIGDLQIRGTTKEVVLATELNGFVQSPFGDERAGFSAHTSINRTDFGLNWNKAIEAGGVLVGEKVEINIEIEAVKVAAKAAA